KKDGVLASVGVQLRAQERRANTVGRWRAVRRVGRNDVGTEVANVGHGHGRSGRRGDGRGQGQGYGVVWHGGLAESRTAWRNNANRESVVANIGGARGGHLFTINDANRSGRYGRDA